MDGEILNQYRDHIYAHKVIGRLAIELTSAADDVPSLTIPERAAVRRAAAEISDVLKGVMDREERLRQALYGGIQRMKATAKYTIVVEMDGDKEEDILFDSRLFSYHLRRMLDTYAKIGYVHIERFWLGDIETDMGVPMTNRRGRCERCGCNIDGIGLCARCTEIMDEGIVSPDDGALKDYLRRFREEEEKE